MHVTAIHAPNDPDSLAHKLFAKRSLIQCANELTELAERIDDNFAQSANALANCEGNVVVTGVGKAGIIGRKLSATLASTGCPAFFMHPTDGVHGDLGAVRSTDIAIALSNSGESTEVCRIAQHLAPRGILVVAITSSRTSTLGQLASVCIELGQIKEVCSFQLIPSTSSLAMMAVCDILALASAGLRGFDANVFADNHPEGSLGAKAKSCVPRRI